MVKMNYPQIVAMLSSGSYIDFQGNTMWGRWGVHDGRGAYIIYSYRTPIGVYRPEEGWNLNLAKYSVTTSKHQGYLRRAVMA